MKLPGEPLTGLTEPFAFLLPSASSIAANPAPESDVLLSEKSGGDEDNNCRQVKIDGMWWMFLVFSEILKAKS